MFGLETAPSDPYKQKLQGLSLPGKAAATQSQGPSTDPYLKKVFQKPT